MSIAKVFELPKCRLCGKIGKQIICTSCRHFWNALRAQEQAFIQAISCIPNMSRQRILTTYKEKRTFDAMLHYLNECIYMLRSKPEYQMKMRAIHTRFQTLASR